MIAPTFDSVKAFADNAIQKVKDDKATQIKHWQAHTNRASQLGYFVPELDGCPRRGVYARTKWNEATLYDVDAQMRFDEGKHQEKQVLKAFMDADVDIIETQTAFSWPEYEISGTLDGAIPLDAEDGGRFAGPILPFEIKSADPNIFARIHSVEDLMTKFWLKPYLCQITLYAMHKNAEYGIILFKNKSSGEMRPIIVPLDYDLGEACLRTAESINAHIKAGTTPEMTDNRDACEHCPFSHICLPGIDFGEPLKIKDDPQFEKKIDRWMEVNEAGKEAGKLWKAISGSAKSQAGKSGKLNLMVGKYTVTGKTAANGAFTAKVKPI